MLGAPLIVWDGATSCGEAADDVVFLLRGDAERAKGGRVPLERNLRARRSHDLDERRPIDGHDSPP